MEYKSQSFTIADLYNWFKSDELILQAKFQRRKIWKPVAKSYLVDTVLRGLPMPKIYYRMQVDPVSVKSVREIIDGQQRLDAIFSYINDVFPVSRSHSKVAGGKRFSKLPENMQGAFLSYDISTDLLIGASDAQVLQIFARINSYSLILNPQEKRNAKFFGVFKETVYELGTAHLTFWSSHRILTNQQIARMGEAELTSELVVGLMAGLQDKKKSLDKYYDQYEDKLPERRKTENHFQQVISWIDQNIGSKLGKTAFKRKALFYSLFMAIADALFGIDGGSGPIKGLSSSRLDKSQKRRFENALDQITRGIRLDEPPRNLRRFAIASAQQTDNLQPRKVRHNYLMKILRSL